VEEDHDRPIHNPGGAGHDSDADGTKDADKMREYLKEDDLPHAAQYADGRLR